jgi:REP element-mobilizing transposase RayT/DNA-binding NarL/FixJ family response regulator
MTRSVLVATPHPTFGELIRLSLEESGDYQVSQVETGRQALADTDGKGLALAILDSDLTDQPFTNLVRNLHSTHPGLRLIVIPPENDQAFLSQAGIKPDAYLHRTFYLPDMLQTVKRVLSTGEPMSEEKQVSKNPLIPPDSTSYPWQIDPDQATRQLADVLGESSACAALMMLKGEIWAFAGSLDKTASQEIVAILARYLDGVEKSDLARFVRLNSNKGEYMVYATYLIDELVLALVFEASTPITRIRSQVIRLARTLKHSEKITEQEPSAQIAQPPQVPTAQSPANGKESVEPIEIFDQPETALEQRSLEDKDDASLDVEAQISLAELLANMPSPDTVTQQTAQQEWILDPLNKKDAGTGPTLATSQLSPENITQESPVPVKQTPTPKTSRPAPPSASNQAAPEGPSIADTQPLALQSLNHLSDLKSVSQSYSRLTYTCLMIPRMPQHNLTGDLAEHLSQWFPQCCLAFGWRLGGLVIRPEYVQWVVEISPTISPGNMIRILRQRTSQNIFNMYSHLKNENPSGDFWAQDYLIINGLQPPTSQICHEFVDESRRRQGLQR